MSAASKSTALAACTSMLVAMVVLAGVAGAGKRDRTPPSPPVDVHVTEATPSVVYIEWTPSVDDVAVAGYYVYRDVGRTSVSRPAYTVTSMRCGESAPLWVQAFDSSGNRSERAETIVSTAPCPDTTPPTTPSGFRQDVTTEEAVVLSWTPSSDASGVVGYGVYEGVTKIASTSEPTVTLDGLRCDTSYQYGFDAVDGAGNRSSIAFVFVQTSPCPDGEAPSAPTGVEVTARTSTSISLSWSPANDNLAVAGYEILVDASLASEVETTSATLSGLTCASSYTLGVRALDAAGNRSETVTITSSTDACPAPAPPNDTTAPSTPTGLSVTRSTATSIAIAWSPSNDNLAVAGYGVYVDGQSVAQTTETSFTVSGLACGTAYSLAVDAYDAAGNRSTRATVTASTSACADTQAPTAPANVAASSRTATSITLSWSASNDNVGVAGYGLYRAGSLVATASGTSGVFANLTCNTSYTLSVDAYDAAGNRSSKTNVLVSTTACQDTSPPSAPSGLTATNISDTALTLTWNASSDNVGVTGYDVYRSGTKVATVTSTSSAQTGLACGTSYWFGVVARDAAGNSSTKTTLQASTQACAGPPPQTGNALRWGPPGYDGSGDPRDPANFPGYVVVNAPTTNGTLNLDNSKDYFVRVGDVRWSSVSSGRSSFAIAGGRNVVVIGGRITFTATNGTDDALGLLIDGGDPSGVVHVEGVNIAAPNGITVRTPRLVQVENVRIYAQSPSSGIHADVIQVWRNYASAGIRINRLTAYSNFTFLSDLTDESTPYGMSTPGYWELEDVDLHPINGSALNVWMGFPDKATWRGSNNWIEASIDNNGQVRYLGDMLRQFGLQYSVKSAAFEYHDPSGTLLFSSPSDPSNGAAPNNYGRRQGDRVHYSRMSLLKNLEWRWGKPTQADGANDSGNFVSDSLAGTGYVSPGY